MAQARKQSGKSNGSSSAVGEHDLTPSQQAALNDLPRTLRMLLALSLGFALGGYDDTGDGEFKLLTVTDLVRGLEPAERARLDAVLREFVNAPGAMPERFEALSAALREGDQPHAVNERWLKKGLAKLADRRGHELNSVEVLNLARAFQCGKITPDSAASGVHFEIAILNRMANLSRSTREKHAEILRQTNNVDDPAMDERTERLLDVLASGQSTDPADIALRSASEWDRASSGVTAREHFDLHFAQIPRSHRPFAHIVRARARAYYEALAARQSRAGQSLDELFPIDPNAVGARRLTKEQAEASDARRREKTRLRVAALRERRKHAPS